MENNEDLTIKVEKLSKSFKEVQAVNDLSFHIKKGEIYGFLVPMVQEKQPQLN